MVLKLPLAVLFLIAANTVMAMDSIKANSALYNARIYTLNALQPWADTLVISGDTIAYVGNWKEAQKYIDSDTIMTDLQGKMVLPGFIDTHMHIGDTLPYVFAAALSPAMSSAEVLAAIAAHAKKYPEQSPVIGSGFLGVAFGELGPTAKDLDAVIPDRPAIMFDEGFHSAWVNTKAMEAVGLNKQSADPVPGAHFYKRYDDGSPTGWLIEGGAFGWVAQALEIVTQKSLQAGAQQFISTMSAMGITAAFDAGMISGGDMTLDLFGALAEQGELPMRIVGSYYVNTPEQLPGALTVLNAMHTRFHSEFFDTRVLKLSLDGTVEANTAYMLEPYTKPEGHIANPLIPREPTTAVVLDAARQNIDVHIHALGDGAVRMGLDMVEQARKSVPGSTSRYTMCHLQIVNPADVPRFAELDVTAQSTPTWYDYDDIALDFLGPERFAQLYPLNSIAASGARLTFGSDYPASWIGLDGLNPLFNIEMAITRQPAGERESPVQPPLKERVSLEQAIKAYTADAAYQLRLEDQIGSLQVGKQADLVVLSRNLFEVDVYDIHSVQVLMTIVDGKQVYIKKI